MNKGILTRRNLGQLRSPCWLSLVTDTHWTHFMFKAEWHLRGSQWKGQRSAHHGTHLPNLFSPVMITGCWRARPSSAGISLKGKCSAGGKWLQLMWEWIPCRGDILLFFILFFFIPLALRISIYFTASYLLRSSLAAACTSACFTIIFSIKCSITVLSHSAWQLHLHVYLHLGLWVVFRSVFVEGFEK